MERHRDEKFSDNSKHFIEENKGDYSPSPSPRLRNKKAFTKGYYDDDINHPQKSKDNYDTYDNSRGKYIKDHIPDCRDIKYSDESRNTRGSDQRKRSNNSESGEGKYIGSKRSLKKKPMEYKSVKSIMNIVVPTHYVHYRSGKDDGNIIAIAKRCGCTICCEPDVCYACKNRKMKI